MGRTGTPTTRYGDLKQNLRAAIARVYAIGANAGANPEPNRRTPERLLLSLLLLAAGCTAQPQTYEQEIAAWRSDKDEAFKTGADSPIPEAQRASFPGLRYFDLDPRLRVPAALTQTEASSQVIEMDTTAGNRERFRVIGRLEFTVNGQKQALTAFVAESAADARTLFVPFGDTTNRAETYGGGRYLELPRTSTGLYDLDFNRAYNPFCVYDVRYECPLPPRENRLPMAIRAGEQMPSTKKLSFGGAAVRGFGRAPVWFEGRTASYTPTPNPRTPEPHDLGPDLRLRRRHRRHRTPAPRGFPAGAWLAQSGGLLRALPGLRR